MNLILIGKIQIQASIALFSTHFAVSKEPGTKAYGNTVAIVSVGKRLNADMIPIISVAKKGMVIKMEICIYQVDHKRDQNRVAFESMEHLEEYQGSSEIDSSIYDRVFEGNVECAGLEDVFQVFNLNPPEGYKGRSLSVSDVVEVIDDNGDSTFHFCDSIGFKDVAFNPELAEKPSRSFFVNQGKWLASQR